MAPIYAATPGDPHSQAATTEPSYNYPPNQNAAQSYPTYSNVFDFDSGGPGNGNILDHQPASRFPVLGQGDSGYPYAWGYGPVDVGRQFSIPLSGSEGNGPQYNVSWDQTGRKNPSTMDGTMIMASPMPQYVPTGTMPSGFNSYEPPKGPSLPLQQPPLWPGPNSTYSYPSSSSSSAGSHDSRHNSDSSLSALSANSIVPPQVEASFDRGPEHGPSPFESPQSPRRVNAQMSKQRRRSSSATRDCQWRREADAKSTAYSNQDAISSAVSPSPEKSTIVILDSPSPWSNRAGPADQLAAQQQQQAQGRGESLPPPMTTTRTTTHRERNRVAASKCRAKTKRARAELEEAETAMSSENRLLSATVKRLRDEVLLLKNELLSHGNCGDALIQQYLTSQARMVGRGGALQQQQRKQQRKPRKQRKQRKQRK
ncbi:hypothetical protein diail_7695 [Diaporthe ilicicola]|nr:hypothetical protein diail_7695 [Diaporthe ilicicola]